MRNTSYWAQSIRSPIESQQLWFLHRAKSFFVYAQFNASGVVHAQSIR